MWLMSGAFRGMLALMGGNEQPAEPAKFGFRTEIGEWYG